LSNWLSNRTAQQKDSCKAKKRTSEACDIVATAAQNRIDLVALDTQQVFPCQSALIFTVTYHSLN
jgi:hypothetical protein